MFFCKPCFKKTFMEKGNYSEGFGKQKPQAEWAARRASQQMTSPPDLSNPESPASPASPPAIPENEGDAESPSTDAAPAVVN